MKKIIGLLLGFVLVFTAKAVNVGDWNLYLAYHNALSNQVAGDEIYASFDGNLLAYHPKDGEVRLLSKLDGLHGLKIQTMGYSDTEKCLVLVYEDLQVDLLFPQTGEVVSIPQIKNAGKDGLEIHQLFVDGKYAVMAMSDGLAFLNLSKHEVTGYYVLDEDIQSAAFFQGVLYAAGNSVLYTCAADGNPLDKNQWQATKKAAFSSFVRNGLHLYGIVQPSANGLSAGLWVLQAGMEDFQQVTDMSFTNADSQHGKLVVFNQSIVQLYDAKAPLVAEKTLAYENSWHDLTQMADGTFWASEGVNGLQAYQIDGETLKPKGEAVGNYGPIRDLCYYMRYHNDRLLIAGGRLDHTDWTHYAGTIMEYTGDKWTFFQEQGISDVTGVAYRDITSLAVDPKNENRVYASAGGTGVYVFENYKFVKHYSNYNSPLKSAAGENQYYVRVDGLNFDAGANLWMVNNAQLDTVLFAMRPDGTWKGFYVEDIKGAPTCEKTLIDRNGRLWMASRRSVSNPRHDAGLLCLDYNGTFDNTEDDVATYRSTFVNQDGKSYLLGGVYSMVEDMDGAIWVGTATGLFVIPRPDEWSNPDYRVTQVKVPRNDGTNLADYLLSGMAISALAIDGANRKWVGSETNGLYLVSADGTEIIHHFDTNNSPLLSNHIYSLAVDRTTGKVMIGTDKGLCAFQSDATASQPSLSEGNVKVYPNPVRPGYHGNVHVTGLTDDAEVKVMTTHGEVVAAGHSVGGTFVWNVRGKEGSRVASGIYYFMIATADGEKGVVAKIVVI